MQLKSVETTPNPNSMKLNLSEQLGAAVTYSTEDKLKAPGWIQKLLEITGVRSVFVCADFVTLNKDARVEWKPILENATAIIDGKQSAVDTKKQQRESAQLDGQVHVLVQTFRGIPIQVKIVDAENEARVALGERFNDAAMKIQDKTGANYLTERYWADHGTRYGERAAVAQEVKEELEGLFDAAKLETLVAQSMGKIPPEKVSPELLQEWLSSDDWTRRLAAVMELSLLADSLPSLVSALRDAHPQVRRLAAAALGASGDAAALEHLCVALLNDDSVGVRRTAGDALSDLGAREAQPAMCQALSDDNKLVRWRAARFLFDLGDVEAIPFLEQALHDPQFEVRLEAEAALERIRTGGQGLEPAWKRISNQT